MALGRRHGAARAGGRRGPVRGRRGLAAQVAAAVSPHACSCSATSSATSSTATASSRRIADDWAELIAASAGRRLRARPQRRRPADRRPRPRPRPEPPRRRHLLRDRGPSQALDELQHAFDAKHCRRCGAPYRYERAFVGHLGHYACPSCDADRPTPDVAADRHRAARHGRVPLPGPHPRGGRRRLRDRAPAARPLQRLQRARRDRRGAAPRSRRRADPRRAARGHARSSAGSRRSTSPAGRSRSC